MTDDNYLTVRNNIGTDECPDCGNTEFTLRVHTPDQTTKVDTEMQSSEPLSTNTHPVEIVPCTITCTECGREWKGDY